MSHKIFRSVRDFLMVGFVALFITTHLSQSFSLWWLAALIAVVAILPDVVELIKTRQGSREG